MDHKSVTIDDLSLRLNCKWTPRLLIGCAIILILREYNSDSIDCIAGHTYRQRSDSVNSFCWLQRTFQLMEPSVSRFDSNVSDGIQETQPELAHRYVNGLHSTAYLFLIQSLFFYMPALLWILLENGKVKCLAQTLVNPRLPEEKRQMQIQVVVRYFVKKLNKHSIYSVKHFSVKALSLVNLVIQITTIDALLVNRFTGLGLDIYSLNRVDSRDTLSKLFPRAVICDLSDYWSEGSDSGLSPSDESTVRANSNRVICLLPINLMVEKIFIFLWFWFILSLIVTAFDTLFYLSNFLSKKIRFISLMNDCHICDKSPMHAVIDRSSFGDWLLFRLLSHNLNSFDFSEIIAKLANKYSDEQPISAEISV